jgi:hypothetical protein
MRPTPEHSDYSPRPGFTGFVNVYPDNSSQAHQYHEHTTADAAEGFSTSRRIERWQFEDGRIVERLACKGTQAGDAMPIAGLFGVAVLQNLPAQTVQPTQPNERTDSMFWKISIVNQPKFKGGEQIKPETAVAVEQVQQADTNLAAVLLFGRNNAEKLKDVDEHARITATQLAI